MVESPFKLCAGRTADGAVPFLGFVNEDPAGRTRCRGDSRICHPGIKQVKICRGGRGKKGRPRAVRRCNRWIRRLRVPLLLGGFSSLLRVKFIQISEREKEKEGVPELFLLREVADIVEDTAGTAAPSIVSTSPARRTCTSKNSRSDQRKVRTGRLLWIILSIS
jgi:hypothetical protein